MTDPAARARVEAWMRETCPHRELAAGAGSRRYECPDCLLAFAAAQRAEEREACALIVERAYVFTFAPEVRSSEARAVSITNSLYEIARHIRARREGPGGATE